MAAIAIDKTTIIWKVIKKTVRIAGPEHDKYEPRHDALGGYEKVSLEDMRIAQYMNLCLVTRNRTAHHSTIE